MRRGLWFTAGAVAGAYGVLRARRAAEAFTPDGLRDRAAGLAVGAQLFGEELRAGMAERETELRERLGLALDGGRPALESGRATDDWSLDPPADAGYPTGDRARAGYATDESRGAATHRTTTPRGT